MTLTGWLVVGGDTAASSGVDGLQVHDDVPPAGAWSLLWVDSIIIRLVWFDAERWGWANRIS